MNGTDTFGGKPAPGQPQSGGRRGSCIWWILGGILILLIILPSLLSEMITDWMWFGSQNLAEVYTTRLWLGIGVFALASVLAALLLWLNWTLA